MDENTAWMNFISSVRSTPRNTDAPIQKQIDRYDNEMMQPH